MRFACRPTIPAIHIVFAIALASYACSLIWLPWLNASLFGFAVLLAWRPLSDLILVLRRSDAVLERGRRVPALLGLSIPTDDRTIIDTDHVRATVHPLGLCSIIVFSHDGSTRARYLVRTTVKYQAQS